MPLTRYITVRPKLSANDALGALILTSTAVREIADLLQFPPAKAAASVLLLIFETVKHVQTNKQDCHRLARRCLSLLVDIRDQIADQESVPPSLLKSISKFEETLESIYTFIKQLAEQKWGARLMRKSTIESALSDYNAALDDAARAFQIATLINIHLAVGDAQKSRTRDNVKGLTIDTDERNRPSGSSLPPYAPESMEMITDVNELSTSPVTRSATTASFELLRSSTGNSAGTNSRMNTSFDLVDLSSSASSSFASVQASSTTVEVEVHDQRGEEEESSITEHHGFSRYHQSQFRLKGKSRAIKDGWWAGATEGIIGGQQSLMLRYEGNRKSAMKRWVRDVKMLQNVYHPNLPQMVGYSNDETPTPFILLANVQTRLPQALLLDSLKTATLARCSYLILQFYRDTLDAALYLQQQMDLSESKIQDYIEYASFRIDAEETVIMGIPPPEVDTIVSWRNYGLAHSIRDVYLKILPNRGLAPKAPVSLDDRDTALDMQRKVNHLTVLARALLPSNDNISIVQERLHKLLGSLDDEDGLCETPLKTLRQIRKAAIAANTHQQAWFENTGIAPHKFSVGDLGYLPQETLTGKKDWSRFVLLTNVLTDGPATLEVKGDTNGKQGGLQNGFHKWDDLTSFELPGDVHGWTVVVPPEAEFIINIVHTNEMVRVHDAWNHLLDMGKAFAETHGVKPEELILITRVGVEQRFRVRDLRRIQYWPASHGGHMSGHHHRFQHGFPHAQHGHGHRGFPSQFGHQFGQQPFGGGAPQGLIPGQDLTPKVFFLFTSANKEHEPYFSQTPMYMPPPKDGKPPVLDANIVKCFALLDMAHGFLNYVQLHAEDFVS